MNRRPAGLRLRASRSPAGPRRRPRLGATFFVREVALVRATVFPRFYVAGSIQKRRAKVPERAFRNADVVEPLRPCQPSRCDKRMRRPCEGPSIFAPCRRLPPLKTVSPSLSLRFCGSGEGGRHKLERSGGPRVYDSVRNTRAMMILPQFELCLFCAAPARAWCFLPRGACR
jgi:hypothetical protein